jgi:transglutaminase-like putative cysteine protease
VPEYPPLASTTHEASDVEAPVKLLEQRTEYVFDEQGNWQETFTQRYTILNRDGVENWGATGAGWSPWYMARPVLRAEVKDPSGAVRQLDPAAIAEQAAYPDVPDVYGDGRILRAPLPGVQVGSTITESILRKTTRPFFTGGSSFSVSFQGEIPRDKVELVIDVPESLPFRYEVLDVKVQREEKRSGGRRRLVFRGENYPGVKGVDYFVPSNVVAWPSVAFSTGDSWKQIASAYEELMNEKLKGDAGVKELAKKSVDRSASPIDQANQLLLALHQRVRYAAVEFGQAAIVPATPEAVMKRTYGDCKDQALTLVAMLRAVGLDATLALLRPGPGEDVHAKLPSLDVFSHAIVVVRGKEPFWIDPTSDSARAGELPSGDQGRLALIIDSDSAELVTTPVMSAQQNRYVETREVRLQELGPAHITESSTATGVLDQRTRDSLAASQEERNKSLAEYVKSFYRADKLVSAKVEGYDDFRVPLRLTVEASGAKIATTNLFDADVSVDYALLYSWLPDLVFGEEPRSADLVLPLRYQAEIRYRIVPPPHFRVKKLPETPPLSLGPALLTREYKTAPDGAVSAVFKFEIDKRQLTPSDLSALRKGFAELKKEANDTVELEHDAEHLAQTNQPVKAVELLRRAVAQSPKSALPLQRLALQLCDFGLCALGREQARAAVALEPTSAVAHRTLGIVLERDEYGRQFSPGFDREGAAAAYQRAAELDHEDVYSKVERALVLEYDSKGMRYGDAASVERAVAAYDAIPAEELKAFGEGGFEWNPHYALLNIGRYDKVRERLAKAKVSEIPPTISITVESVEEGGSAGIALSEKLGLRGEERSNALAGAAGLLYNERHYPEASVLFGAAAQGSSQSTKYATLSRLLSKVKKVEPAQLGQDKPADVVIKAQVLAVASSQPNARPVEAFISSRADKSAIGLSGGLSTEALIESGGAQVPRDVLADTVVGIFESTVDGSDQVGYRVRATAKGLNDQPSRSDYFVVKEGTRYLIRSSGDENVLGCEALYHLGKQNQKAARQWLEWAAEGQRAGDGEDPLREAPFMRLYAGGKGNLELSAASLCASSSEGKEARQLLMKQRGAKGVDASAIEHAIAEGLSRGEDAEGALASAEKLLALHPNSTRARDLQLTALWKLERFDTYERLAKKYLEDVKPGRSYELAEYSERLARAQQQNGKLADSRKTLQRVIDDASSYSRANAYNNAAWAALFFSPRPKDMLDQALQGVQLDRSDRYSSLHTLASVYLDLGKHAEAQKALSQLLEIDTGKLQESLHYVLGGMLEAYGFPEAARSEYQLLEKPKGPAPTATYVLAQRRLKVLDNAPRR